MTDFQTSDEQMRRVPPGSPYRTPLLDRAFIYAMGLCAAMLYQIAVFIAALNLSNRFSLLLVLICMGAGYLSALIQISAPRWRTIATGLVLLTIAAGAIAGAALFV